MNKIIEQMTADVSLVVQNAALMMKEQESLAELRGILRHQAKKGETTNYIPVAWALRMFSGGGVLAKALGEIMAEDAEKKCTPKSALCVSQRTGVPGTGFFALARTLYIIGPSRLDELLWWKEQIEKFGATPSAKALKLIDDEKQNPTSPTPAIPQS